MPIGRTDAWIGDYCKKAPNNVLFKANGGVAGVWKHTCQANNLGYKPGLP